MTAALMGPAPDAAVDPLAPEHVAPLFTYLASPAASAINGEVFVVHGGVAAVLDPPRMRAVFHASEHGSPDGMWTLDSVAAALGPAFAGPSSNQAGTQARTADGDAWLGTPPAGFACEDTLSLATETTGFCGPQ